MGFLTVIKNALYSIASREETERKAQRIFNQGGVNFISVVPDRDIDRATWEFDVNSTSGETYPVYLDTTTDNPDDTIGWDDIICGCSWSRWNYDRAPEYMHLADFYCSHAMAVDMWLENNGQREFDRAVREQDTGQQELQYDSDTKGPRKSRPKERLVKERAEEQGTTQEEQRRRIEDQDRSNTRNLYDPTDQPEQMEMDKTQYGEPQGEEDFIQEPEEENLQTGPYTPEYEDEPLKPRMPQDEPVDEFSGEEYDDDYEDRNTRQRNRRRRSSWWKGAESWDYGFEPRPQDNYPDVEWNDTPSEQYLTPEVLETIRSLREEIRCAEGLGGQCHLVSEDLMNKYGWPKEEGYFFYEGEPALAHVWNYLPNGAILDATADQLGLDDDVRVIEPDDPRYEQYRWEWDPEQDPEGETRVMDRAYQNKNDRGRRWWLPEEGTDLIRDYDEKVKGYEGRNSSQAAVRPHRPLRRDYSFEIEGGGEFLKAIIGSSGGYIQPSEGSSYGDLTAPQREGCTDMLLEVREALLSEGMTEDAVHSLPMEIDYPDEKFRGTLLDAISYLSSGSPVTGGLHVH